MELTLYELPGLPPHQPGPSGGLDGAVFSSADWDVLNPPRARLALDAAVFNALGLTVGELDAVYAAVSKLVSNRLRRAGSA